MYNDEPLIARIDRLERDFVEIQGSLTRIERNLFETRDAVVRIQRQIARSVAPVAHDAPDGTVAIRDPDIIAQQYRTGTRGHAPKPTPTRPVSEPPENVAPPHVEGSGLVGEALTSTTGDWANEPTYRYQWKKMEGGNPAVLPDATTDTYTPTMQDNNKDVYCMVLATNAIGQATADSNVVTVYAALEK